VGITVVMIIKRGDHGVETLQLLLIDELKDLYSAEKQIVHALPKLAKASASAEFRHNSASPMSLSCWLENLFSALS
jgi:Domain of unknown function (DUF892)